MVKIPLNKLYPPPPDVPTSGGLGHKVAETFARAVIRARDLLTEWLEDRLINFAIDILERLEGDLAPLIRPIITEIRTVPGAPAAIQSLLEEVANPSHQGIGAALAGIATSTVAGGIGTVIGAATADWGYNANRKFRPSRLDPATALTFALRYPGLAGTAESEVIDAGFSDDRIEMLKAMLTVYPDTSALTESMRRGDITDTQYREYLRRLGYDQAGQDTLILLARQLLDAGTLRDAYLRGFITEPEHDERLGKMGLDSNDITLIKRLYQMIPGVQDLITMAVKEAFDPDQVEQLGLDLDFPEAFGAWAQKQGLSADWAHKYWQAHWQLPSASMGFEMLHRTIISPDELAGLLKALDYSPVWRDKLIRLSYNTYTRVDIRRMYQLGILNQNQVLQAYKEIGYDDEHATNLTLFTVTGASAEEKDLTKADIVAGYRDRVLFREDASALLVSLGYDTTEADFYLTRADLDFATETRKAQVEAIHLPFVQRIILESQARNQLLQAGLTGQEVETLLDKWRREIKTRQQGLSRADVESMYRLGLSGRDQTLLLLQSIDYPAPIAEQLVTVWDTEAAAEAAKEAQVGIRLPSNADIKRLLWQGIILPSKARELLAARLYAGETIEWYMQSWSQEQEAQEAADVEAQAKRDAATVRKPTLAEVRTLWLEGIIGDVQRDALTVNLGIPEEVRGYYIDLWSKQLAEIQAKEEAKAGAAAALKPKLLSAAQANSLYISGVIDREAAGAILTAQGYSELDQAHLLAMWTADLETLTANAAARTEREAHPEPRLLTTAQLKDLTKKGIISEEEARAGLAQLLYSAYDIDSIVAGWATKLEGA